MRLALGVMPTATLKLAPQLIELLDSQAEDVAVTLTEGTMANLLPPLRSGELDFIVGVLPNRPLGAEFSHKVFYEDPFVIAVRREHPLARRTDVSWDDLRDSAMVLPPEGALTRELLVDVLARHKISIPRCKIESVSTMMIIGVLQKHDMFGLLPLELAEYFAGLGILSILPLEVPNAHRNVGMLWRSDVPSSATHKRVLEIFRSAYPDAPGS